ncbi:MAG TPA: DUF262 domain-containing protein [Caulobacteraceae bacterium]|jgi:hypothetical protein|nr:DUF262 domain-containing protein [Caulobacteraceae bacterium]
MSDSFERDDLDEEVTEDLRFWEKRQRELVTAQVDYNLGTLRDLAEESTIELKPHFQRRFRWDNAKRSKLIESLLLNVPIPPIYLNEDKYGKYSVIDGKQRISTVQQFLGNSLKLEKLSIFHDLNGKKYSELPPPIQTILRTRPTLRAIIVLRQSDPAIKYEVFQRLNTGGVPLNAQEIRNNVFAGRLNSKINELGDEPKFHGVLGIKDKAQSKLYQEMRDSELVLRYMTFADEWETFQGGVKTRMDGFMDANRDAKPDRVAALSRKFSSALNNVTAIFGDDSFRRWVPEKRSWRNQVLAALYDAQMLGLQEFKLKDLSANKPRIMTAFKRLFSDQVFLRSVNAATNTPSFLKHRVAATRDVVRRIVK